MEIAEKFNFTKVSSSFTSYLSGAIRIMLTRVISKSAKNDFRNASLEREGGSWDGDLDGDADFSDTTKDIKNADTRDLAEKFYNSLSEKDKAIFVLLIYNDNPPTNREAAKRLGLPEGTVSSWRFRLIKKLRAYYKENGEPPPESPAQKPEPALPAAKKSIWNKESTMSREQMGTIIRSWENAEEQPMPAGLAEIVAKLDSKVRTKLQAFFLAGGWYGEVKSNFPKEYAHINNKLSRRRKDHDYKAQDVWVALGASADVNNNSSVKKLKTELLSLRKSNNDSFKGQTKSSIINNARGRATDFGFSSREFGKIIGVDFAQNFSGDDYIEELKEHTDINGVLDPTFVPSDLMERFLGYCVAFHNSMPQEFLNKKKSGLILLGEQTVLGDPIEELQKYLDSKFRPCGGSESIDLTGLSRTDREAYDKILSTRSKVGLDTKFSVKQFIERRLKNYIYRGQNTTVAFVPVDEVKGLLDAKCSSQTKLSQYDAGRLRKGLSQHGKKLGKTPSNTYSHFGHTVSGTGVKRIAGVRVKRTFGGKEG